MKFTALKAVLFPLFVGLTLTGQAHADSACRPVDLRSSPALNVVRNQGQLGWCFAYAAADMYGHGVKRRLSAIDLAVNYYRDHPKYNIAATSMVTLLKGGRQDYVKTTTLRHGICPETKISSFRSDSPKNLVEIEKLANTIAAIKGSESVRRDQIIRLVQKNFLLLNKIFPMSPLQELQNAFLDLDAREKPLVSLMDNICADDRVPVSHLSRWTNAQVDQPGLLNRLKIELNNKRPVLISYNSSVLKDPNSKDREVNHISVIVGSRVFRGQCQYLLKNSWGTLDRKSYHPTLVNAFTQDGNYLWIPEWMVGRMAQMIDWVAPI